MRGSGALALLAAVALAVLLPAPADRELAACDPAAASNVTATCTGTTVNQGGGAPGTSAGSAGYGTGGVANLTVTVVPGASVTGFLFGMTFDSGTVTNFGTITGGVNAAIFANNVTVINSGTINNHILANATVNVTNSGTINGGVSGDTTNVTNSGTIAGNISGGGSTYVANSGTILGDVFVVGPTIVVNSGTIQGVDTILGQGASIMVINSGTISATNIGMEIEGGALTAINSGTIAGGAYGIRLVVGAAANVTNSGTISGGLAALQFDVAPDTLALLPGSKIIGAINLAGGGDTVISAAATTTSPSTRSPARR